MARKLDDLLTEAETEAAATKARVDADEAVDQASIQTLRDEVARLQAIIDAGEATPAQEARFDALKVALADIEKANPPTP